MQMILNCPLKVELIRLNMKVKPARYDLRGMPIRKEKNRKWRDDKG